MPRQVHSETQLDYVGNIGVEYIHEYTIDKWEEEGHGFHQFEDITTKAKIIQKVFIEYEGWNVDITDRLTKEEKKDLESLLW